MMGRVFHRGLITFLGAMSALSVVSSQVRGCNQQLQTYISIQTNLTLAAIEQFKLNYTWDKFDLGWDDVQAIMDETQDLELLQVCNEQNTCQRVLPMLPTTPYTPPSTPAEAGQQMAEMLEFTRQYAYAVEILFLDQCLHEDSFQQHVHEISCQLDILISAMIDGSKQCGVTIRDANIRNLIDKVYRGANTALRDQRAIWIIRQCYIGLHYIRQFYSLNDTHPLLR